MQLTRLQNAALTIGAVLGSLCLMAALTAVIFGMKPLMFKSGSMEPTISTGGLALSVPVDARDLRVGDIVSTKNSAGSRITHRIAAIETAAGYSELTLKGDANEVVDPEVYLVTEVDRVFWSAPLLGYAVAGLSSPIAVFIGGLVSAYLLFLAFGMKPKSGPRSTSSNSGRSTAGVATAIILATVVGASVHGAQPAQATFRSNAVATSAFTAARLSAPNQPACSTAGGNVTLSWSHVGVAAGGYTVQVNNGRANPTETTSFTFKREGGTAVVQTTLNGWTSFDSLTVQVQLTGSNVTCTLV